MKTILKLLAWISGGVVLLAVLFIGGFWLFLSYTADRMCGNEILATYEMQNIKSNIIVFQRDCWATTGFSTQVSIIEFGKELPNEKGNIFIADTDHGKAPSGIGGGPEVRIEVNSENSTNILHHPNARVFKKEGNWKSIIINYGDL